jgi:hypothetical protein
VESSARTGPRFPNTAGSARAYRTFVLFVAALAAIYGVFMGLAVRTSAAGANDAVEAILTAAVAVSLVVGWAVTLGQAPAAAWLENGHLVVHERTGRIRRFPTASVSYRALRSNSPGPLGPEATEFVEVSALRGPRRTYLVGANYFDFAR